MSETIVESNCQRNLGYLSPGKVNIEHFRLLVDISNISSERILLALELFLVKGLNRQQSCAAAGISQSTLSIKLRQIQEISRIVVLIYPWYAGLSEGTEK